MAMGQAVGTAAALCQEQKLENVHALEIAKLQQRLKEQGAVIEGVY